jgi:hypothetical protein
VGVAQFVLQGGEERFCEGIVPALAGAADGQANVELRCQDGEFMAGVLGIRDRSGRSPAWKGGWFRGLR